MISIRYYNKNNNNSLEISRLQNNFNVSIDKLNLVNNKTIMISLILNKFKVGTLCMISNSNLKNYMISKGLHIEEISGTYLFRANKGMYIYNLSVHKNFRKKGIAKKLLEIGLYVCKVYNFDYCYSHCENEISHHIFKKKGFSKENIFTNNKNERVILMSYWLN